MAAGLASKCEIVIIESECSRRSAVRSIAWLDARVIWNEGDAKERQTKTTIRQDPRKK